MFGLTKKQEPIPVPPPEFPRLRLVTQEETADDHYAFTLSALGMKQPAELISKNIKNFLAKNGMETYSFTEVEAWMDSVTPKGKDWEWFPLRHKDLGGRAVGFYGKYGRGMLHFASNEYKHAIPAETLMLVQRIESDVEQVAFFVTDYVPERGKYPDPFILVMPLTEIPGARQDESDDWKDYAYIFDYWNEPGFRK